MVSQPKAKIIGKKKKKTQFGKHAEKAVDTESLTGWNLREGAKKEFLHLIPFGT